MTLTLPRRAVVDPDELPASVSAPSASATATDTSSGQPSDPEREWLRKLNWGLFETLVESAFSRDGFAVGPVPQRLDGRADMLLQRRGEQLLVQCKYWKAWQIGTSAVAELRGLVDEAGLDNGMLITAGTFSPEAAELAEESGLLLLDGDDLLRMAGGGPVLPLADETTSQWALPKGWTAFGAPTCPLCEAPMLYKRVRAGEHTGMRFWGCRNYPTCRAIREVGPAYAGLPLERPVPGVEAGSAVVQDADVAPDAAVAQAVDLVEDAASAEEAAPAAALMASPDAIGVPETGTEPAAEDVVVEPAAVVQMLPSAPVPTAAVAAALPVAPQPVASVPAVSLPSVPLPAAPVIESLVEDAAPADAVPVETPVAEVATTVALPVAPPPGAAPIITEPSAVAAVDPEPIAEAPAVVLPSAPVPQPSPTAAVSSAEPGPEVPNAEVLSPEASVAAEMAPAPFPAAPATDVPAAPVAAVMPPAPVAAAPVSAAPVASLPPDLPAPAPIAPAPVAPAQLTPPPVAAAAAEEALLADATPAEPELAEPEAVEPEAVVRRRAELGLPALQLPPGSEDAYTVLLAHPTWSDPRDEDDVPSFVPEEHAPYQWPTSADLVDEDRAPISWPESAPEPAAEVVAEVVAAPSRRRQYVMIGAALAVAAVLTIAVAVLIPAVMTAMKLLIH